MHRISQRISISRRWWTAIRVLGLAVLVGGMAIGIWGYLAVHNGQFDLIVFLTDFYTNISTDLVSIAVTVLVIDTLNEQRLQNERKRATIQQIGSPVSDAALEALRIAHLEGWVEDGSLRRNLFRDANLRGADLGVASLEKVMFWRTNLMDANLKMARLQEATMEDVNLQKADLSSAKLMAAHLFRVNLKEANLQDADLQSALFEEVTLQRATLSRANLKEAKLVDANLETADLAAANLAGANLSGANLQGADLLYANLQGALLSSAVFDSNSRLPDDTTWTPTTDLTRFTDSTHPMVWKRPF